MHQESARLDFYLYVVAHVDHQVVDAIDLIPTTTFLNDRVMYDNQRIHDVPKDLLIPKPSRSSYK
jgi:hypothetical protein